MISADLRLLVAIGWENRHGQKAVFVAPGEQAASKRLLKRGLLVRVGSFQVGLTGAGEKMLLLLDKILANERAKVVPLRKVP